MRALIMAAVAALAGSTEASAALGSRSDQWIYRTVAGGSEHVATFLASDYSSVLFRAWCEQPGQLAIEYFGDGVIPVGDGADYALLLDETPHLLKAEVSPDRPGSVLLGRLKLTPALAAEIARAKDIDIDAPNEMDEPWYTGQAEPLKRIVRDCAARAPRR